MQRQEEELIERDKQTAAVEGSYIDLSVDDEVVSPVKNKLILPT